MKQPVLFAFTLVGSLMLGCGALESQNLAMDHTLEAGATAGCARSVSAPTARSKAAGSAKKILPPAQGVYLGAYQIPANEKEYARFTSDLGQTPAIVFSFHDWLSDGNGGSTPNRTFSGRMEGGGKSPLNFARYLDERGAVLALSWAVYCCDYTKTRFWLRLKKPHDHVNAILRGDQDAFIRDTARRIKANGAPIMLAIMPEFNWQGQFLFGADGRQWMDAVDNICDKYGDPAWPDGPERVRDMHMHIIDRFREEGVTNVTWMMYAGNQYMVDGVEGQSSWLHPQYYYPGDAYIDWVGQSVYFTNPQWENRYEDVSTFDRVFRPGYDAWRSVTNRPMILPEFGILANVGEDRTQLWNETFAGKLKSMPGVKAVTVAHSELFELYFDIPRLNSNAAEMPAVRQAIGADTYYKSQLQ